MSVQLKERRKWKVTAGLEVLIYDGHIIVRVAGHEAPFWGDRLTKLKEACTEAQGDKPCL